jgi:hypothetical protein
VDAHLFSIQAWTLKWAIYNKIQRQFKRPRLNYQKVSVHAHELNIKKAAGKTPAAF